MSTGFFDKKKRKEEMKGKCRTCQNSEYKKYSNKEIR